MSKMIHFPDLNRTDTHEKPVIMALSGILTALCLPFSTVVAIIFALPVVAIICSDVYTGIQNIIFRFKWSRSFDGHLSRRAASKKVQEYPDEYVLYVQYYTGGFNHVNLAPLAILERCDQSKRFAIYPASWKIIADCKYLGIPIIDSDDLQYQVESRYTPSLLTQRITMGNLHNRQVDAQTLCVSPLDCFSVASLL